MADSERDYQLRLGQFEQEKSLVKSLYDGLSTWERSILPFKEPRYDLQMVSETDFLNHISTYLVHHWNLANVRKPALRIFLFILFSVGLLLVGIPAAFTFVQVTLVPLKHFVP
jgi:hypothetical protein